MSTKEQKIHGRKAKLPVLCFLNLSAHFYVWVTVWVRQLPYIWPTPKSAFLQQKGTENRSFRCLLELLGGFEPPTSSLPSDKMPSSRWYIRLCGHFCHKKDEVENSLLHVFRPLVSPCGSRCGSEPPASSVWVNFL